MQKGYGLKFGDKHPPEYSTYYAARTRCNNPRHDKWKYYGGRGIKFLFESFEQFFAELGPRPAGHTLDRINSDGNYEPGNVRWATREEQSGNQQHHNQYTPKEQLCF